MGCFGYICKGCGTPINGDCFKGGEKCVMIHVRHGEEIGRVEGHYDEYGRVVEQKDLPEADKYRGDNDGPTGRTAICDSEFSLEDSYFRLRLLRVYNGHEVSYLKFAIMIKREMRAVAKDRSQADAKWEVLEARGELEYKFAALPIPVRERYSGTVAWHALCYDRASAEAKANLTPSDSDRNQSWGLIRKKYR
jgi:hypothetical protein